MAIKLKGEEMKYTPTETLEEVNEELKFFKDMAIRNKDKKEVYQETMRIIDIFSEQKARIEKTGEI